jgi:hypothetical protein
MLTSPSEIRWGRYKAYEGAYYLGSGQFKLPANPTNNHLVVSVICSTEGGSVNAINAYDRCILSAGLVQWCEAAYFLVSNLLGHILSKNPSLIAPLQPALDASNAEFKQKGGGKWRFFFKDSNEVDQHDEQTKLFLLNSSGLQGSWDSASKEHVKLWVASFANTLIQPEADVAQVEYTAARVKTFATREAATILFDGAPDTGWVAGLRAAYLSYAANLPAIASKQLLAAVAATTAPKWSPDWCITVLKQLTFGPNISIYPGRYNKIRPVIEKNWGINLPDFADELKAWQASQDVDIDPPTPHEPSFQTVEEIQTFLISLGHDLGPAGADGKPGKKTQEAIQTFQRLNGLLSDGLVGPKTRAKMLEVYRAKN